MANKKMNVGDEVAKLKKDNSGLKRRVGALEKSLDHVIKRLDVLAPEPVPADEPVAAAPSEP